MTWTRSGNKYNAKGVKVDGKYFDSDAEYRRWRELELLEQAGEIIRLEFHPQYRLVVNNVPVGKYEADSRYIEMDSGKMVVEDVKSPPTVKLETYKLKKALMLALHGVSIREVFMPPKPRARNTP